MKCVDGDVKHDPNKHMTGDVAGYNLFTVYALRSLNGFYEFSLHFIIFLVHMPITQWKLYQNVFGGRRLNKTTRPVTGTG